MIYDKEYFDKITLGMVVTSNCYNGFYVVTRINDRSEFGYRPSVILSKIANSAGVRVKSKATKECDISFCRIVTHACVEQWLRDDIIAAQNKHDFLKTFVLPQD